MSTAAPALALFEDHMRIDLGLSDQTVATYLAEARLFLERLPGGRVETAESGDVIDHLLARKLEGLDERTIAKALSAIRALFRCLVAEGVAAANPTDLVEAPRISPRIPQVFTVEEVERLLAAVDLEAPTGLRDRALFELIYSCGLRVSEAVDLTMDRISFREAALRVLGKGRRERWVPMGEEAALWMRRYLDAGRPSLAVGPSPWVFLNIALLTICRKNWLVNCRMLRN